MAVIDGQDTMLVAYTRTDPMTTFLGIPSFQNDPVDDSDSDSDSDSFSKLSMSADPLGLRDNLRENGQAQEKFDLLVAEQLDGGISLNVFTGDVATDTLENTERSVLNIQEVNDRLQSTVDARPTITILNNDGSQSTIEPPEVTIGRDNETLTFEAANGEKIEVTPTATTDGTAAGYTYTFNDGSQLIALYDTGTGQTGGLNENDLAVLTYIPSSTPTAQE